MNQCIPDFDTPYSHANRNYQIVTFPSGLTCLLINDPSSHLFSAAMAVQGGHSMDPIDIPGLAHLCEHLVVGSENSRLHSEVTNAGGTIIAYTSSRQTCFGFEISTFADLKDKTLDFFATESSLDMFRNYFTLKKFNLSVVTREMLSVHDEHIGNTTQVNKILWQGLKILASDSHPFSRFTTGSMQTFTKPALRTLKSKVKEFYHDTYIPKNMSLILKGPQSSNHLRKLAISYFGLLENPVTSPYKFSVFQNPNPTLNNAQQAYCTSPDVFQDIDCNILWINADFEPRIRLCFPMRFGEYTVPEPVQRQLCNLIGCESQDSWCYFLKSTMQYLLNVVVSVEELSCSLSVLICDLEMTKRGMRNTLNVVGLLFFFIEERLLKLSEESLCQLLDSFGRVEENMFLQSMPLVSSLDEVCDYASRINAFDGSKKDFIRGYKKWSPGEISCREVVLALQKVFIRSKVKIEVLYRSFSNLELFQQVKVENSQRKCEYYGFEYTTFNYNFELTIFWTMSFEAIKQSTPQLSMNTASPKKMTVGLVKHRGFLVQSSKPILKVKEEYLELWLQQILNEHQVYASVNIEFSHLLDSRSNLVGIEMLTAILGDSLKYKLYHLELLDCNWGIYPNINGRPSFQFTYKGGPGYLVSFLETAIADLRQLFVKADMLTYEDLRKARIMLRRLFVNYNESRGFEKMEVMTHQLLEGGFFPIEDRIEELEMTDLKSLARIGQELSVNFTYSSVLLSGNTAGLNALSLKAVFDCFKLSSDASAIHKCPTMSKVLPPGVQYIFNLKGTKDDPTSIVYYYIQMGSRQDNTLFTTCKLLQFILSTTTFKALRTERSLSYSIISGMKLFRNTFGLFICVPAVQKDCQMLLENIEEFLEELERELVSYDSDEWTSLKSRFLISLESVDEDDTLPSSLFASLQPLISSSGYSSAGKNFKEHWNSLNQVLNNTYNFESFSCEEFINKDVILGLSQVSLCKLFKNKMSMTSKHRSILVITKPVGDISTEIKISTLATMYASMLARCNLVFTVEELASCFKNCSDQEHFSDLKKNLKGLMLHPSQKFKFHKFNMYYRLSKILGAKSESARNCKRQSVVMRETFSEVKYFRQRCLTLSSKEPNNRKDEQVSIVSFEDVLDYYKNEVTPKT